MKQRIQLPDRVKKSARAYVASTVMDISLGSYKKEAEYTLALIRGLEGVAYEGVEWQVKLEARLFNTEDRPSSDASAGADFAIVVYILTPDYSIRKALLFRTTFGSLPDLKQRDRQRLDGQLRSMLEITRGPKILNIEDMQFWRFPRVISVRGYLLGRKTQRPPLQDYFVNHVLSSLHGDTRPKFVSKISQSPLHVLRISVIATG
ncbi:MAG: hypothetical protein GTO14_15675 [Anaerolineales bacterium]|nr:hypothetical protein [Anaerolineales bacterium]